MFGYSLLRAGQNQDFVHALYDEMLAFDVPIEGIHTETGPGVYEAAIVNCEALRAADRATLFKAGTKDIAHRFGIVPTFMARWNDTLAGSSGHIHQSLIDKSTGKNVFFDATSPQGMSSMFRHYLAGILNALPELLPLFAPTVNSYKRLVDGFWAPTRVAWGIDNRTVAVRALPGGAKSTRLEFRVSGADVNPYLAIAGTLAAGLDGIERQLPLDIPPTEGSAYKDESRAHLPRTLQESTEKMANSELAHRLLGDAFVTHFVASRRWEWRRYCESVTDWERRRYLELI
jgi:glutamine synthetase